MFNLDMQLKNVLLPTFGTPTIPIFTLFPGRPKYERGAYVTRSGFYCQGSTKRKMELYTTSSCFFFGGIFDWMPHFGAFIWKQLSYMQLFQIRTLLKNMQATRIGRAHLELFAELVYD